MDKLSGLQKLTKAIAGFVFTFGSGLVTAAVDDGISSNEWWVVLGGALVAGAGVYYAPANQQSPA